MPWGDDNIAYIFIIYRNYIIPKLGEKFIKNLTSDFHNIIIIVKVDIAWPISCKKDINIFSPKLVNLSKKEDLRLPLVFDTNLKKNNFDPKKHFFMQNKKKK